MKLSISNIAWDKEYDEEIYSFLNQNEYAGIEIAPTRLFPENPYDKKDEIRKYAKNLKDRYNLSISSIQSIWYGKDQNIFNSKKDRDELIEYTKRAIDFANIIKCKNLVFGCPKNRSIPNKSKLEEAIDFFKELGDYASLNDTTLSIEPNPVIYNTNFINKTEEAFKICKMINSPGIMVNIDIGTMIYNDEKMDIVDKNIDLVNHIHISEPYLNKIKENKLHFQLKKLNYDKFFSIEMKNLNDLKIVKEIIYYIKRVIA